MDLLDKEFPSKGAFIDSYAVIMVTRKGARTAYKVLKVVNKTG